ncbi:MAG: ATP-dependent RecD-like DNA helicase [Clostridia bacterium]|nr:ATP-dependent RecD-like DNA helicase [Clostridia bacterium]
MASEKSETLIRISGSIEHVIYANEDNGYAICDMGTDDGDELITITGTLPYIGEGDLITVYGVWVHNPKYGRQFRVEQFEKQLPADVSSILRYLASGAIKGVGPKTAKRIVDEFGEESFEVIEKHPEWLAEIPGITRKKALAIGEDFASKAGIRASMLFFREIFGPTMTVKIYQRWGGGAVDIAKQNPYRLCDEIDGIGFERADRLAMNLGLSLDHEERICSGILYLLSSNASQNGHTCLPFDKVVAGGAQMLSVDKDVVERAIVRLLDEERLVLWKNEGKDYLYERSIYEDERFIARKLTLLQKTCPGMDVGNISSFLQKEERASGIQYAALQRQAIFDALEHGVLLLTGGPGTGKTTVVRALLGIFSSMEFKVALCAPTGRAAKRLSESTACEAKTVHRLLEYSGEGAKARFMRDENNLLDEHVVIVDEASMVDTRLACALLRAIKPGSHVILIGDADQLPSVGAGDVLRDLINSECFATVRLDEIFRQARKSLIVTNAHRINQGQMPRLDVKDNDFFYLARGSDDEICATVADLYRNRLPRTYGDLARNGTQVISPSRKGEVGTEHLNQLLQAALNPPGAEKREYRHRDLVFREGDRVMQVRNNYDIEWEKEDGSAGVGIFNGDIGVIERVDLREQCLEILFEDRRVMYHFDLLEDLEMAYAVTVHKSQGSEYPIVILPLGNTPPMLLSRNLLYTAVTRAQSMVILVGRQEVLGAMVENNRPAMRYTGLRYLVRKEQS